MCGLSFEPYFMINAVFKQLVIDKELPSLLDCRSAFFYRRKKILLTPSTKELC